jgi:hypothetical protein
MAVTSVAVWEEILRMVSGCIHEVMIAADKKIMAIHNQLRSLEPFTESPDPFADLDVPPSLEECLMRHRRHVAELVRTMKMAGISDETIAESVSALVALYKEELMVAIREMKVSTW